MNEFFKKDLYRYFGDKKISLAQKLLMPPEIRYLKQLRKTQKKKSALNFLKLKKMQYKTHIQIGAETKIGEGLYIGHTGRLIINKDAVIGKNCNLATGVTIGQENRGKRKGCPVIGDNVWVGTNAVIVGNIKIGNDVMIAPLTFVNFDVPDHSIVVGNPAKVISRENATEGYINHTV